MRLSGMGKPIAIFMKIRATENKVSVLTQCLMLVYCFTVYKVLLYPFSMWLSKQPCFKQELLLKQEA